MWRAGRDRRPRFFRRVFLCVALSDPFSCSVCPCSRPAQNNRLGAIAVLSFGVNDYVQVIQKHPFKMLKAADKIPDVVNSISAAVRVSTRLSCSPPYESSITSLLSPLLTS